MRAILLTFLMSSVSSTGKLATTQAPSSIATNSTGVETGRRDSAKNDNGTAKIRALVNRQVQAWEKHDFGIAAGDWLSNGELISPGGHVAAKDMQTAIAGYFEHFTDLRVAVKDVFISADGNKAAIQWDWTVTRRRDGVRGVTHDAIIVHLVGGKIASWSEYFDFGDSVDAKP